MVSCRYLCHFFAMNKKILLFIFTVLPLVAFAQVRDEDEPLAVYTVNEDSVSVDSLMGDSIIGSVEMAWPGNVAARIDKLLEHKMFETTQVGILVYDLTADSVIYRRNDRQLMRPASIMKNVTAIAAIEKLGGSYQFCTSLYYKGVITDNVFEGDLYCVGGMDPAFGSDDMRAFVESVAQLGVDTIRGRIVADLSFKDSDRLGEGWCWDDDNPVLTPLLVSRKDVFMERFVELLRNDNIVVEAEMTEGCMPNGASIICTRSHSLDQILMKMMKDSNNLYAESMFYQLAAYGGNRPATARPARQQIERLIKKLGLNPARYKIADGSGLSLYNYVSPELQVELLRYAYNNSTIFNHLYESMPIAGEDGTLKKRMRGTFAAGNVRAKTGTLTGISTLAGYCTAANGHLLCFCIMNQGVMHNNNGRNFQDRVCVAMCKP